MTIIKWPGGKKSEVKYIKDMIPKYKRYIEPFFGGGAVYFALKPKNAVVNDISKDLINFYNRIISKDYDFLNLLKLYSRLWNDFLKVLDSNENELLKIYNNNKEINSDELIINKIYNFLYKKNIKGFNQNECLKFIIKSLNDKVRRIKRNHLKSGLQLSRKDLLENIKTGFMAGVYMYFRNISNSFSKLRWDDCDLDLRAVIFYLIREYCYGSMFRYNKKGEFNIPYGGLSYNRKDIVSKVERYYKNTNSQIFLNTKALSLDFQDFLERLTLSSEDFIFLDPPYDSKFSDYEGNEFNRKDQIRLKNFLISTKAKFIMIIKETEFIKELYKDLKNINIDEFEKQYKYNVRGRNNRDVNHLVIYNFNKKI